MLKIAFVFLYGARRTIGTVERVNVNIYILRENIHTGAKATLFRKRIVANRTFRLLSLCLFVTDLALCVTV